MNKFIRCILISLLWLNLPSAKAAPIDSSHLRISLITCGPGDEEVWQVFGHTAVRILDSSKGTDIVYNYGTFNGFDENFEINFMRGKLLYYLSEYPFVEFLPEYEATQRSVVEQVLVIDGEKKQKIASFLEWNARPQNRSYKYDFFFDNCATRIRDILPESLGEGFAYGPTQKRGHERSFRTIINKYFETTQWVRFGVNILLGSKTDKIMTNSDIMFLPDFLFKGTATATYHNAPIAEAPVTLLRGGRLKVPPINIPVICLTMLALLVVCCYTFKPMEKVGNILGKFVLTLSGILGILILVMWLATNHQACQNNFNILWALPTNLMVVFGKAKGKGRYSLIALLLIGVVYILHFIGIQQILLAEMTPVLLLLAYIHYNNYQQSKVPATPHAQS